MIDPIAGKTLVAEDQFQLRQLGLQVCLQPAVMLHSIGERIADDDHVVAGLEWHRRGIARADQSERRSEQAGKYHLVPAASAH